MSSHSFQNKKTSGIPASGQRKTSQAPVHEILQAYKQRNHTGPPDKPVQMHTIQRAVTIKEVMEETDLKNFIAKQKEFQKDAGSMDNLRSAGFEYEFASFTKGGEAYTEQEIIPSHQTMATAPMPENKFGLGWNLESDSLNTLEMVTPPLLFSGDTAGSAKSKSVYEQLKGTLAGIPKSVTIPAYTTKLAERGIGDAWTTVTDYQTYQVIDKQKSGSGIYGQENVSLTPQEIGDMLTVRFNEIMSSGIDPGYSPPTSSALAVKEMFTKVLPEDKTGNLTWGASIFARYISNVTAIPSMHCRQVTGERFDTAPTEVKETLDIWIKTDALNLLEKILKDGERELFLKSVAKLQGELLGYFKALAGKIITMKETEIQFKQNLMEASLKETRPQRVMARVASDKSDKPETQKKIAALKTIQEEDKKAVAALAEILPVLAQGCELMKQETEAFIGRVLALDSHKESLPTSDTSEFLEEKYGSGEGVRKGTYLPGIPTGKESMYVTEIRNEAGFLK